jgi:hypothetical protein
MPIYDRPCRTTNGEPSTHADLRSPMPIVMPTAIGHVCFSIEQQRATKSNKEQQRATKNNKEQQRAVYSRGARRTRAMKKRYDFGPGYMKDGVVGRIVTNSMHRLSNGTTPVRYEGTAVDALVYKAEAEVEAGKEAFTRMRSSLVGLRVSAADDQSCKGKLRASPAHQARKHQARKHQARKHQARKHQARKSDRGSCAGLAPRSLFLAWCAGLARRSGIC